MIDMDVLEGNNNTIVEAIKTGKRMVINCETKKFLAAVHKYLDGAMVQDAFPFLTADEREFLLSGLLPAEFDALFDEDAE